MLCNKKTKRSLAILLIAMALLAVPAAAWATHKEGHNPGGGKPGGGDGGSVGTGTIYYASGGLWSMNPDGSGKTPLLAGGGDASIARHPAEGDRWFLQVRGVPGFYPITTFPPEYWNYEWRPDDLEAVGFTGDPDPNAWTLSYTIMIDTIDGEADTFKWHAHSSLFSDMNDVPGGDITGDDQEVELLINGSPVVLTINFGSTTGHNIDDWWEIYVRKTQRSELFAVREDGQIEVQLTDDPNVQLWSPNGYPRPSLRWATHDGVVDGKVSYLAQRWGPDGAVVEGSEGLYEAEVDWATLTPDTTPTKLPVSVPMGPYDWSPDGNWIVYSAGGIRVADAYVEGPNDLLCGGYGARWSPVLDDVGSTLIAFQIGSWGYAELRTISPDGSSETTIVTVGSNRTIWSGNGIFWSPEGTHLIYTLIQSKGCIACQYNDSYDVYRVGADGSDPTNLTKGIKENCFSLNWRD